MKNKPILLVAGEPNSIFFEIFFKSQKKKEYKSPLILICNKNLLIKHMKKIDFKRKVRILNIDEIKNSRLDNKKINIININFENSSQDIYRSNSLRQYIEMSFDVAFRLIRSGLTKKFINGPVNKKSFLNKKFLGITEYISKKFKKKK